MFERVFREIATEPSQTVPHQHALTQIHQSSAPPPAAEPPVPEAGEPDDLLAVISLGRLISDQATLPDVAALVATHLRRLAPGGTCAFYLLRADEELAMAHAVGPLAAALRGTSVRVNERLTGFVAA